MSRFVSGVVSALLLVSGVAAVPAQVAAAAAAAMPGTSAAAAAARVGQLTRVCIDRGTHALRDSGGQSCRRGEKLRPLSVVRPLRVCAAGRSLTDLSQRTCRSRRGTSYVVPTNRPAWFCSDPRRNGRLRAVPRPSSCTGRERALEARNHRPGMPTLLGGGVPEQAPTGTAAGTLSARDPDAADVLTFALVAGAGDTDNELFTVDAGRLLTSAVLDFEEAPVRHVRVRVTDVLGSWAEQTFAVPVLDVDEPPHEVVLAPSTVAENEPGGTLIGGLSLADADAADTPTYELVDGEGAEDNTLVTIDGADLVTRAPLDHETQGALSIRVRVTDRPGGRSADSVLAVSVSDVPEAPTGLALSSTTVEDDATAGSTVGTLSTTDPDAGDTSTYSLVGGTGSGDNALFQVDGSVLRTAAAVTRPAGSTYAVRVRSTDSTGRFAEQAFAITVTAVNHAPDSISLSPSAVAENEPAGTQVGVLSATDADARDTFTFSLVSGPGDADNGRLSVASGGSLRTAVVLDHESDAELSIRVRVTDQGGLTHEQPLTVQVTDVAEAPTAVDDGYLGLIGNTRAVLGAADLPGPDLVLSGALPLVNDSDPEGDKVQVVPATVTTSAGGTLTIAADGSFRYEPPVGARSVTDRATYTVTDGSLQDSGTINLSIGSRLVWYVDAAGAAGGNGTSARPFTALAALGGTSDPDGAGDEIFLHRGSYLGGLVLEQGQSLVGHAVGLAPGLVAPAEAPVVADGPGPAVLRLATGSAVRGLDLRTTGGTSHVVQAQNIGTAVVGPSVRVSSAGSGDAVTVEGGAGDLALTATVSATGAGRVVRVAGRTGGAVTFAGSVSAAGGAGVVLTGNAGASIAFEGGLALDTGTQGALTATSGGVVEVTGAANSLRTTTGTPLTVRATSIGARGLTFRSIASEGAVHGIDLESTGTAGGLMITGGPPGSPACGADAAADRCTGGRIASSTGAGVRLVATHAPSLSGVWLVGSRDDGVYAASVTGGLRLHDSLVEDNGDGLDENGIDLGGSSSLAPQGAVGLVRVTATTVRRSADSNVHLANSSGTVAVEVLGNRVTDAGVAGGSRDGVRVVAAGTAEVAVTLSGNRLHANRGDQVQLSSAGAGRLTAATVRSNTLTGSGAGAGGQGVVVSAAGAPWSGAVDFDVVDNVVTGARGSAVLVSGTGSAAGTTFEGRVRDNTVGDATPLSCSSSADGIEVSQQEGAGTMVVAVTGNTVRGCADRGIALDAGVEGASASFTVIGNTVSLADPAAREALHADLGLTAADSGSWCLDARDNALAGGPSATPAGTDLVVRHRYGPLRVPPAPSGTTTASAVQSALSTVNPAATVTVSAPVAGTYLGGGSCALPTP